MKTVSELARELNISTQAIYKKINQTLKKELLPHVKTIDGQKFIDEAGEAIIKRGLQPSLQPHYQVDNKVNNQTNNNIETILEKNLRVAKLEEKNKLLEEINNFFMEQNRILQDELTKEREHAHVQADKLANLAEQLAELTRNNQILLGAEQSRTNTTLLMSDTEANPSEEHPVKKKSFWSLFKKQ